MRYSDMLSLAATSVLLSVGEYEQYCRDRRREAVPISPLTGKQPLANPASNRKALALEKAMRRQARATGATPHPKEPTQ